MVFPFFLFFFFNKRGGKYVALGFPHSSVGKDSICNARDPSSISGLGQSSGEGIGYPLQYSSGSAGKESTCNARHLGWIPGSGRSPGEGIGYSLQYSGLESSMDWSHKELDTAERLALSDLITPIILSILTSKIALDLIPMCYHACLYFLSLPPRALAFRQSASVISPELFKISANTYCCFPRFKPVLTIMI